MQYRRGDIFYVGWSDGRMPVGSEQRPGRPGVIVSNDEDNEHSNTVQVVYLTSQQKPPRPTHVRVVCKVLSTALCEQLHTVDKSRLGNYVRSCTDAEMEQIDRGLLAALGIEENSDRDEVNKLAAERDVYKYMVEQMLDRIIRKKEGDI